MIMATPKKIVARPEHHHKFLRDYGCEGGGAITGACEPGGAITGADGG
jgi:hypothetical protein